MSIGRKRGMVRNDPNPDWPPPPNFVDKKFITQDEFTRWYEEFRDALNLKLQAISDAKQDK